MTSVAVLGPGGVGGFVAAALARSGVDVTVVAREPTAEAIARDGIEVDSVRLGEWTAHPRAVAMLELRVDVLVVAVKAPALASALGRVRAAPGLVVPLLNGIEHLGALRDRFGDAAVAGSIRIAAERTAPGRVVHTSPAFRIELAPERDDVSAFVHVLRAAEIPAKTLAREADVLWSKLVRLNALACTTAAAGAPIGEVRAHPAWRARLGGAVDETAAVAAAEGAAVDSAGTLAELMELGPKHTSSLHRDLDAGAPHELDAIPGAVLRAGARHGVPTPTISELVGLIRERYPAA
ncbi:MAG TPA: 2-dehydropantoate 2-reductase [Solirubrobacteraceae bacterium]|nr:2-dehydropantoate 2-reductase [Solirubrobacteraceae bacterium]